jgi:hypothetical protein
VYTLAASALIFVGLAALYTMYLSGDLAILTSMPIGGRTIFAYKFWETPLANSTLFVVLALPVLLAYGIALLGVLGRGRASRAPGDREL